MAVFGKRKVRGGAERLRKEGERAKRRERREECSASRRAIGGRIALVACAVAVCAVPPVFVNGIIGYIPLVALLLAILVSFLYLQVLKRSLTFSEESLLPSCERGTAIEFVLLFENRSILVFPRIEPYIYISDLFGGVDVVTPATMVLMPRERRDFRFQAQFDHIGTYSAGVQKIVISDLLGLFSHTVVNENRHRVEVLPKLFDVSRVDLTTVSSEESQRAFQAQISDDMDYAGVRDYELGDPLKAIHWKLSASLPTSDYLTRLFETYNDPGISIIIDTTAPEYDSESLMFVYDGVVECALSVNEYARTRGLDSVLMFHDVHGERTSIRVLGADRFHDVTARLPKISAAPGDDAVRLLRQEGRRTHARDNIAFCTAHVNEDIVSALIEIKNRKRNPMLLVSVPHALEGDELRAFTRPLRQLDSAHIVYYAVSSAEELEQGVVA